MRHREEAPVLFPRRVVDLPAALDFRVEVLEIEVAKGEPLAAQRPLGVRSIAFGQLERAFARACGKKYASRSFAFANPADSTRRG